MVIISLFACLQINLARAASIWKLLANSILLDTMIQLNLPAVSNHLKCEEIVVAYGRWTFTVGSNYKGLGGGRLREVVTHGGSTPGFDCTLNPVFLIQFLYESSHLYAYLLTDHMLTLLDTCGKQSSSLEQVVPDALLPADVGTRPSDLVYPVQ